MKTNRPHFLVPAIALFLFLAFLVSRVSAALPACSDDSVCVYSGQTAMDYLAQLEKEPAVVSEEAASTALTTVREITSSMPESTIDSKQFETLYNGRWCKGLEDNSIEPYEIASGQPQLSWEQVIVMVSKKTGVKPQYLCTLLWMESRGDAYDVGLDGECGAFQTMPQYYQNYEDYCSSYRSSYAFVGKTCERDKWGNYPFNAYPKAELHYDDSSNCFHPLNSATAGAMELAAKLKEAGGDVREAFRRYNGSGPAAVAYADKAYNHLQNIVNDAPVALVG